MIYNGLSTKAFRPKRIKWKLHAKSTSNKGYGKEGLFAGKRLVCDSVKHSPSHKQTRIQSPHKTCSTKTSSTNLFSSRHALNWDGTGVDEETNLTQNEIQAVRILS